MTRQEMLRKALSLVDAPHKWSRATPAMDQHGVSVMSWDARACRFSVTGAVSNVYWNATEEVGGPHDLSQELETAARAMGYASIVAFSHNPTTTHQQVLWLFEDAIKLAGASP